MRIGAIASCQQAADNDKHTLMEVSPLSQPRQHGGSGTKGFLWYIHCFRRGMKPIEVGPVVSPHEPAAPGALWGPDALDANRKARRALQARYASRRDHWIRANRYYYDTIISFLRFVIEPEKNVLELRCLSGRLLNAVSPSRGVGVDITPEMIEIARGNYPELEFICCDPESLALAEQFDYILFSNIYDTVDVIAALQRLPPLCRPESRLIIYNYNHIWEPILELASRMGGRAPLVEPNWLSERDVESFLHLVGFESIHTHRLILLPKWLPLVSGFLNRCIAPLPGFRKLCMINMVVARPVPRARNQSDVSVSIIVPCKNERANIAPAVRRIPEMGRHTEILFCDDQSTDGTADEVRRMQAAYPEKDIRLIQGPGICKAENVWTGFAAAKGYVLMILDGDLTVMPEELPYFFHALIEGKGEFINGSRLVYPMQGKAMKGANVVGNKFFSLLFSFLLSQRIKDTLCGTKVLWRRDWQRMQAFLGTWGVRDLWGDYELLFGASRLQLRIQDLPVHYQDRIYGVTKMTRVFSNGLRMLRMCWAAWWRLKGGF
jgi:SAM-dependent methyltransferase